MARVVRVTTEIMLKCKENNVDIDYFKLQKLVYLCQYVHYGRFNVPLCPENIYNWTNGGGFKEIYAFFKINNIYESCDNINISMLERQIDKLENINHNILSFEKETINFVLNNYANMNFEILKELVLNDPLYKNINIGDRVDLEKLNDLFITKKEIKDIQSTIKLRKSLNSK